MGMGCCEPDVTFYTGPDPSSGELLLMNDLETMPRRTRISSQSLPCLWC